MGSEMCIRDRSLDVDGKNVLHRAAYAGHLEVVRFLVGEHGAATDIADRDGDTEIVMAARNAHFEVVRYLAINRTASAQA